LASSMIIALFLLVGCAASGPKLASSIEDIAGTWRPNTSNSEIQIDMDGTYFAINPSDDIRRAEIRFEGTRFIYKDTSKSACALQGYETGIYEIELLENGNLKFILIEDECPRRVNFHSGRLIQVEWEPVP